MPATNWLGLVALIAAIALLLVLLLMGVLLARRGANRRHKPLQRRGLRQSHDDLDPWREAARRHGSEAGSGD